MANPSPTCQVKEGAGAWQDTTDGVDVTAGSSLTIRLVDTSPYAWSLECIGTDETNSVTAVNAGLVVNNAAKTATLTAPAVGSALLFRSTINGGVAADGTARPSYSATFKVSVLTATGFRVGAFGETIENDSNYGTAPLVNELVRTVDGLVSGTATKVTLVGTGTGPAGAFAIGDVVCSANDASDRSKVKLATSTNIANADAASLRVMLETGVAGETKLAAGFGTRVLASVLGIAAAATVDWVTLDTSAGRAQRTTKSAITATQYVIGETDPQGNATVSPRAPGHVVETTASVSAILSGDGGRIRARRGIFNLLDFKVSGAFPDETGTTPINAWMRAAIASLSTGQTLFVPLPSGYFVEDMNDTSVDGQAGPLLIYDDTAAGNKYGIHIKGEGPHSAVGGRYHFRTKSKAKGGNAASITARTNGGTQTATVDTSTEIFTLSGALDLPNLCLVRFTTTGTLPSPLNVGQDYWWIRLSATTGQVALTIAAARAGTPINITTTGTGTHTVDPGDYHQTIQLLPSGAGTPGSGTAGSGDTGITVATKSRWLGRHLPRYNCATDGNNGPYGVIVDVPSNDVVRVSNRNDTAAGTDANNGAIGWWVDEPVWDIRAKDTRLESLSFGMISNADVWCFVEASTSARPGGRPTSRIQFVGCSFASDSGASSGRYRDCLSLARDTVGTNATAGTYFRGYNGLGEPQYYATEQTSETLIYQCLFLSTTDTCAQSAVALFSTAAQSKFNHLYESSAVRQQFFACVPKDIRTGGAWAATGLAHFNLDNCETQQNFDAVVQIGGYSTDVFRITECYGENVARILKGGGSSALVHIESSFWIGSTSTEHPSGAWIETSAGHLWIEKGALDLGNGNVAHISHLGTQTTWEAALTIRDFKIRGTTNYTTEFGIRQTTIRGPFDFGAGGQKLGFKVDGGAQVDVTFSQANFNAACGYTVNLRKVHTWEVAKVIATYVSGAKAWGDGDDAYVYVRSATNGTGGSIRAEAPLSGTSANTILGFGLASTSTNRATTRLNKDSSQICDHGFTSGTSGKFHLIVNGVKRVNSSTGAQDVVHDRNKRINSGAIGGLHLDNVQSLNGPNAGGVTGANLNGKADISDTATEVTISLTTEEDAAFMPVVSLQHKTGTPASKSCWVKQGSVTASQFIAVVDAAPGVGNVVTINWMVSR